VKARAALRCLIERFKRATNGGKDHLDLAFGDDQRRRKNQRIAAAANQGAFLEATLGAFRTSRAWHAIPRLKINRRQQTDNTDIDDVRSLCKFVCRLLLDWSQSPSASEQIEITIDLECRERSRTGRRMVRIGLAVE
jgi:hypothetical protein